MKRKDVPVFGCLQDLKIVNSSMSTAGPFMGTLYAEMGADVILIENTSKPDPYRAWPYAFATDRRNVRTICTKVFAEEGREILKRLLKDADIFIEASPGGTWAKQGLSDEVLWQINPKLVIVHISGFGQFGIPEMVAQPSYENVAQCYSGYVLVNGAPGSQPEFINPSPTDYFTAYTGAFASLAAYHRAQQTGKGESLDLATFEAALRPAMDGPGLGFNLGTSAEYSRSSAPPPSAMVFKCKDGKWRFLFPQLGRLWEVLEYLGLDESCGIPRDAVYMRPADHYYRDIYYPVMKDYCDNHTSEEVDKMAKACHCLYSPILDFPEMVDHPHFQARGTIIEYHDDNLNKMVKETCPVPRMTNYPQQIWRGGFYIGQDNDDIMEELGFSPEEIQAMYDKKLLKQVKPKTK